MSDIEIKLPNNNFKITYKSLEKFKDLKISTKSDCNKYPHYHGVYVIYDYFGKCLYVGKSFRGEIDGEKRSINARLYEHRKESFTPFAYFLYTYELDNHLDILLLERILIKYLNPIFNNDNHISIKSEINAYLGAFGVNNKGISQYLTDIDYYIFIAKENGVNIPFEFETIKELQSILKGQYPNESFYEIRREIYYLYCVNLRGITAELLDYDYPLEP